MARFVGLGVRHLKYKACTIHGLVVEDEPNWSELCRPTTTSELDPASAESEDGSDPDNALEGDLDDLEVDPDETL